MLKYLARALLVVAFVTAGSCSDSSGPSGPAEILILNDGGSEAAIADLLTTAGNNVTQGGYYSDYTGTDFSDYDLVILLNGLDYGEDLQAGVEQALLDYVSAGGTLMVTEWLAYSETQALIIAALPLAYQNDYCDQGDGDCNETYTRDANHTITNGVPDSFETPADWSLSFMAVNATSTSTNITVLFTGSIGGPALAVATRGSGRLVQWNMGTEYAGDEIWDANTSKILTNIAQYSRR
jgi:hypothetical protein